jgi:adenylate cyclase
MRLRERFHLALFESAADVAIYEIGPFRLDATTGVLVKAGVPAALGSRAVAVLTSLVKRANEYVSKASLMDTAWPGLVVEESNLSVQVSAIRRVLAQAPGGERWIETLPRRGYRFVGPVKELRESRPPEGSSVSARSNPPAPLRSFIGREREPATTPVLSMP